MKQIFSLLLFSAFLFSANAQNKFDKLDGYFDTIAKYNKAMGTVVLAKKGQTIYERSLGYADLENKKPNNDSTEYRIGSISKSFTATLILKAKEQSKLLLDQTINKWFPNIKNANKITVSNLLYHRSGIHNFTDDSSYLSWNTKPQSEAQLISRIEKGGSDFEPDSKMQYSNSNYVLLTIILERVNGKSYQRLLNEQIIKPLKLTHTYYGGKINAARNEAYSYDYNGEKYEKSTETDMSVPLGAGAIVSTPSDLVKFINALFAGKVLSKESLAVMTSPKDNFGMGLFQIPFENKKSWGHTGGIDAFRSVYSYFPEDSISLAICSNGAGMDINNISIAVLDAANGIDIEMPDFSKKSISSSQLATYTGTYSGDLPFKITFTVKDGNLVAQAEGQPALILAYKGGDTFAYEAAGAIFEFHPEKKSMILKQAGRTFEMKQNNSSTK